VYIVTHGFDPETENTLPDKLTDKFTITYTGGFAPVRREPDILLAALQKLISTGIIDPGRIEVRFYGTKEDWVNSQIEKYGLSGVVRQYGKVPMPESLVRQRESQLLFNPKWNDPQEPGIHSMKILEYLAARRPILATGRYHDVVDELLEETGAGVCTSSVEDTAKALQKAYHEYLSRGQVAWHGDAAKTGNYSHRAMAGRFADLLDQLTGQ
jgi:glycosyltransferase involved in cell wall biosynthesis